MQGGFWQIIAMVLVSSALVSSNVACGTTTPVEPAPMTPEKVAAIDAGWNFYMVWWQFEPLSSEHRAMVCEMYEDADWNPDPVLEMAWSDEWLNTPEGHAAAQLYVEVMGLMQNRQLKKTSDDKHVEGDHIQINPDVLSSEEYEQWIAGYCAARDHAMLADGEIAQIAADVWNDRLAFYGNTPEDFPGFGLYDFNQMAIAFSEEYGTEPPALLNKLIAGLKLSDQEINDLLSDALEDSQKR